MYLKNHNSKERKKNKLYKNNSTLYNNMKYKYSANKKSHISPVMDIYIIIITTLIKFLSNQIYNLSRDATLLHKV